MPKPGAEHTARNVHAAAGVGTAAHGGRRARPVNRHLVIAGGIFNRAEARWGITHNPADARKVKRLREPSYTHGRINFLTPGEVQALVRATPDEADQAMFLAAAMTGLRQGELLALTWADVDFMGEKVHVRQSWDQAAKEMKATKSGRERAVPLALAVASALASLRNRERSRRTTIWCSPTGPASRSRTPSCALATTRPCGARA
jgi:integrase